MKQTYRVPEENMESLQKKIKSLNTKANKLVNESITLTITGEEFVQDKETKDWNKVVVVEINGEAPHYNGYEFIATLNHNYSGGNVIKSAGQPVPEEYRTVPIKCDHCGINRFRKDTYVVLNTETNEYKQVGSGCLKDFFQGRDPHQVAKYAALLFDMDSFVSECSGNSQPIKYINLKEYLEVVNEFIKKYGFMSAKRANEIAENEEVKPLTTAQEVYNHLYGKRINEIEITNESTELVEKALEWIKRQLITNDYMHNLNTICNNEYIDYRGVGIAASLIPMYYKATHEKTVKEIIESNYVGNTNDKIETKVTLVKSFSFENQFGVTVIYKFEDENGNILIWKTSPKGFEETKTYNIKGTVKEHEEYRDKKQTILTRCKVESI